MMRTALLLGMIALLVSPARGQTAGSCETGRAIAFVTNPTLQASVFNTGGLFFGGRTTSGDGYLIPKQSGNSPLFAAGLWLGGYVGGEAESSVGGELRVAAARYGSWDFWPGPLEDAEAPPDDCSAYDRIYTVYREDLRRYYETGELADDLRDWPHQLGAPVIDGDGVEGNYNLAGGDQPDLIGDMAAWWVMNDAGNDHGASGPTGPLGVEVRAQAFLYGWTAETVSPVLLQTTFIRYEIINRGTKGLELMHATLFADPDLGDAGDDYIGTDTLRNMVFVYNDSNEDASYGSPPPALGIQILQGPLGLANGRDDDFDGEVDEPEEEMGATSTGYFINGGPSGFVDPGTAEEYYNSMQGLWPGGAPYSEFGIGRSEGYRTTRFYMTGDPVTESFWSEVNTDGNGTDSPQGQRRMLVSTGPFRLSPGESTTLLFAFPFGQGSSNLRSVAVMRSYAAALQSLQAQGFFASSRPVEVSRPDSSFELALSKPHPNPSRQPEAVLTLPEAVHVRATVYDALGRQLEILVDGELPEGPTELAMPDGLAPGTYLLRVEVPGAVEAIPFTVIR